MTLVQTLAALGGLDVLVNNAGAVRVGRRDKTDEAELQAMIDVTAAILLTRAAPPVLIRRCRRHRGRHRNRGVRGDP